MIKKINTLLFCLIGFSFTINGYAWNGLGHRLIAQIAYRHLTPQARDICNHYNHALDSMFRPQSFMNAGAWMDGLRYQNETWLGQKHYIDIPFSTDGTPLIPPDKKNAVSAIYEAKKLLEKKNVNDYTKGFALRILIHVVGDLHQPLHAADRFSHEHPDGDHGGNRFHLGSNSVASNLHAYWDKAGGLLQEHGGSNRSKTVKRKAYEIDSRWPCQPDEMDLDPTHWATESHQMAVSKAYSIKSDEKPSEAYQLMTKQQSEERIALAGCRLAGLLNKLVSSGST